MHHFNPNDRVTKLWGIPGTSSVPSPEKQLKKLIDKGKKEFQGDINKLASKAEGETKRVLNKASREITHGLHEVGDEIEGAINQAVKDAEDAVEEAFYAVTAKLVDVAVNDLVDAIQAKLFTGPIFVKLWWFRFHIDPNTKIDALQQAALHPPKGKHQIVALLLELIDDDEVEFRPEVPLLAAFGGKIKVGQIEEAIEFVVKKLGLD